MNHGDYCCIDSQHAGPFLFCMWVEVNGLRRKRYHRGFLCNACIASTAAFIQPPLLEEKKEEIKHEPAK